MKPIFVFAAIIVIALLFTVPSSAQDVQPAATITDTLPKIKMDTIAAPAAKTDSPKIAKKAKRKKKDNDTAAYNPYYYSGNTVGKPLPYNSNKEKEKPVEKPILPVGEIIRDAVIPKKNN
jgi:hypothetical protein